MEVRGLWSVLPHGFWDLNSGRQAFEVNALLPESSCKLKVCILVCWLIQLIIMRNSKWGPGVEPGAGLTTPGSVFVKLLECVC